MLSLEQKENADTIRDTVITTLKKEQVIHWFENREISSETERKISQLVIAGKVDEVLCFAKKLKRKEERKRHFMRIKNAIRHRIGNAIKQIGGRK